MAKVPGVRNTLPARETVFGEEVSTENPLSILLFGARVKTSQEDAIIGEVTEVVRLSGKNIQFTDWQKSNSKKLAQFREKIGDRKYKDAREEYGKTLRTLIRQTARSSEYKKADVEEKNDILSGLDTKAQDIVFKKYNFTYKQDKKK
jgi:molybdopterin converting factor small subunit